MRASYITISVYHKWLIEMKKILPLSHFKQHQFISFFLKHHESNLDDCNKFSADKVIHLKTPF